MNDPHAPSSQIAELSATEMSERFAAGTLTSVAVVEALIERVRACDPDGTEIELRAVAALNESALAEAEARDEERRRGYVRSPLHGVPILIKDNIEAIGLPGAAGSTALSGRPTVDAPVVQRLREAGVILLGSTNLSEWANMRSPRSTSGWSATGGLVGNPWALDRSAGGSSSGSGAGVAAGYAPIAVGTETDGSIVCPSSVQGLYGIKPTVGSVPADHVVPISASQDSPGPMGRHLDDVVALLEVLRGAPVTPRDPGAVRYVFAANWLSGHPGTDELAASVARALADAGHTVIERQVAEPTPEVGEDELTVLLSELVDDLGSYLSTRGGDGPRSLEEVVAWERSHHDSELIHFGHEFFVMALETGGRKGERYAEARARNLHWAVHECLEPALADADVLIAPSYAPAWKSDLVTGGHTGVLASCATTPAAIAGWPIANVPVGLVDGLPVGLAIIGRADAEDAVVAAARGVERLGIWRPSLPSWARATRG